MDLIIAAKPILKIGLVLSKKFREVLEKADQNYDRGPRQTEEEQNFKQADEKDRESHKPII